MTTRMLTICLSATVLCISGTTADELQAEIVRLHQRIHGFDTDTEALRRDFLALLDKYNSPEDVGRVYAGLTAMYCYSGCTDPVSAAEYAERALGYPLGPLDTITVYEQWGDALQVKHRGVQGEDLVRARKEAVLPYLRGLKYALDYDVPDEDVELPRVELEHGSGTPHSLEERMREGEKKAEPARRARLLNDMVLQKRICVSQTVFLYSRYPFKTEELRAIASEILQNEAEVEKLVAKVEAEIDERMAEEAKRSQEKTVSDLAAAIEPPGPPEPAVTALALVVPEEERPVPSPKAAPEEHAAVPNASNRIVLIAACCVGAAIILGLIARRRVLHRH